MAKAEGVEVRLRVGFYFDFASHPFAHAGLFDHSRPVHEALQRLPAYLTHWFTALASSPHHTTVARVVASGHRADDKLRWHVDGEHLRRCLDTTPATAAGDGCGHAVQVVLTAPAAAGDDGPAAAATVKPSSICGRPGGRLYVGAGARLLGCHIDLSQGDVYIGADTVVDPFASVCGPTIVGRNCVVRTGARIRGNCIFGDRVVVGGEIKSSVLMDEASFPHQSYVGDSICGFRSHFGNGATRIEVFNSYLSVISANLGIYEGMKEEGQFTPLTLLVPVTAIHKSSDSPSQQQQHKKINAGTAKLGIIMGDYSQVGCNSVSDPATFLGPRTVVYALTSIRKGFYGPNEVLKNKPFEAGVIERAAFITNKL